MSGSKLILIVGATGAQGIAVVEALLAPAADGSPSPFSVRALTRDPSHPRAQRLAAMGAELFSGSVLDLPAVDAALDGVYGAFINTDGFEIGDKEELYAGIHIFELAKLKGTVKHYVWSNLEYFLKKSNWNPAYDCDHTNAKGRVGEFIKEQSSDADGMRWTQLTTAPYMDMLNGLFTPIGRRADGTVVFAAPMDDGKMPIVALSDIGFFARYIFDNPQATSGKDIEIASDVVSWEQLVQTFSRVTGQKAEYLRVSMDAWFDLLASPDRPVAKGVAGPGAKTFRQNFTAWWAAWRDGLAPRDMDWIRAVNPRTVSLEQWMRRESYTGQRPEQPLLKVTEGHGPLYDPAKVAHLLSSK